MTFFKWFQVPFVFLFFCFGVDSADRVRSSSGILGFSDFPVEIVDVAEVPVGYSRDPSGAWRDSFGKMVESPAVNFSGRYYVGLHSCGAGCRYYSLTDLQNGDDQSSLLEMFGSTDPPSRTRDGHTYITNLVMRPGSSLLIAQYIIDAPGGEICRERLFVLAGSVIKAMTPTRGRCGDW